MKLQSILILLGVLIPGFFLRYELGLEERPLPSPNVSRNVDYFPTGPEEKLPNLKRALKQYKLEQEALKAQKK